MQTVTDKLKDSPPKETKKDGKHEISTETVKELIKKGINLEAIEKATGFPREEILKLAAEMPSSCILHLRCHMNPGV
ncbi:MAG: hypothetical protein GY940_31095 [bacterium]|nr:hypothetical protein [bacterium]